MTMSMDNIMSPGQTRHARLRSMEETGARRTEHTLTRLSTSDCRVVSAHDFGILWHARVVPSRARAHLGHV